MARDLSTTSLDNLYSPSLILSYLTHLFTGSDMEKTFLTQIKLLEGSSSYSTFHLLYSIHKEANTNEIKNKSTDDLPMENSIELDNELLIQIIEEILLSGKIEYIENILLLLPYIRDHSIYLSITKLYMKYEYKDKALASIKHSLKEYDLIDSECAFYLSRNL